MTLVQIELLGTVSVTVEGYRHPVRADKVRGLLAALALNPGWPVSLDELVDELWPRDKTLGNARNAVQAHAARLRRCLDSWCRPQTGSALLRTVGNGYLLDLPPDHVDGNRFLDLVMRGAADLDDHPQRAADLLQRGLQLWRGPALIDAGDGPRCRAAAELYEERRVTAWEDLISARLALGQERRAVPELRQLVTRYPLRERFCEQLMLALYRCGRQSEALELFHRTRRRLDSELGLEPGPPLRRRYAEILSHDPVLVSASI
jgi:DNA-binding SARP family transcriptional activator